MNKKMIVFGLLVVLTICMSNLVYAQASDENQNWFQKLINFIVTLLKPTAESSTITQTENQMFRNLTPVTPANEPLATPVEKIDDKGRHLVYINESEFYKNRTRSFSACYGFECFTPEERKGQDSINYFKSLNLSEDYVYVIMQFEDLGGDPSRQEMDILAADNITLFEYHGDHSYYAKASKSILESKSYDFVRWTGIAENASWKVDGSLKNKTFGKNCTGYIQLSINFYQEIRDIPNYNNKKELIINLTTKLIAEGRDIIDFNASVTNIYKIASFNFVQRISGGTPVYHILGGPGGFNTYKDPLESIKCYD